jgi:cell division protein FtsX
VNTSILSYNTQQLKGSTQAQYAIQNYMRNRASMQADNKQATVNNYFGDDGIYQNGFLNQSQQIAN